MTVVVVVAVLLLVVLAVAGTWLVRIRNRLVGLAASCDEAWSDVDAQLRRRHDLVPPLVETVRGYADHEASTLDAVTAARASAVAAAGVPAVAAAETGLTLALRPLLTSAERYPALRADQHFALLQSQLSGTEDEIAAARDIYNSNAQLLDEALGTAPGNAVGPLFGVRPRAFFPGDPGDPST